MSRPTKKEMESTLNHLSEFRHRLFKIKTWGAKDSAEFTGTDKREEVTDVTQADVITSEIANKHGWHTIMLDLDVPAHIVESSTEGHSHLYIDVPVTWHEYMRLVTILTDIGVIEKGYHGVSRKNNYTSLRLPWVKKGDKPDSDFPQEEMVSYGKTYTRPKKDGAQWRLKK